MKHFYITATRLLISFLFLIFSLSSLAQNVGINPTGSAPNSSAALDVDFPDKGVLIPRVALTGTSNAAPLGAHVAGMIVYNTATAGDVLPGFYYNDGTRWISGIRPGNAPGDMVYWNGTAWVLLPVGTPGQFLQVSETYLPMWGGTVPVNILTTAASLITGTTATSGGNIINDGGSPILSRGVCWSTTVGPTIANSKTADGTGTGIFTSNLTGLTPVTTYYVRAYAINSLSIIYGNEISFTTLAVLPTLAATTPATSITGTTAVTGGNVTSTGGADIIERGVCYATTSNPTIANMKVIDPSPGPGSFVSNLTGLTGATTYYVRAYATNSVGTAYGTQISFVTATIPPTLVTVAASAITGSTAVSGGSMSWNGGGYSNYQNYGVAYATTPGAASPTYVATNTTNYPVNISVPIAPWTTNLTGLSANTTYYIRSYLNLYRTSPSGWITVFGNELSFTTGDPTAPVVGTTTAITSITTSSASSGGTITADGGAAITAKGVCWDTSPNPVLGVGNFTSNGTGIGSFTSNISGLSPNTTYYVRAYATNSVGTSYGPEQTFATCGTPIYTIGQSVAGGIVYYVDCSGQHGLIVSTVDLATNIAWGCSGTVTGATGTAIYTGLANTAAIITACPTAGIPARLCADYAAGGKDIPGFTNWYLPSVEELRLMKASGLVNPPSSLYSHWSSSEGSATLAAGWFFYGNYQVSIVKTSASQNVVRAVRAF
ncbi:MAG TPA: hypothetical protein VHO68_04150 [Bacteroidales bacterium]|nr:hypothetical protein [Bacteroidales bacterium]